MEPSTAEISNGEGLRWARCELAARRAQQPRGGRSGVRSGPTVTRENWREIIERSGEVIAASESGAIFYGGTHADPNEMQRGTFTATDVTDCYWGDAG